jgi:hypothetical protein
MTRLAIGVTIGIAVGIVIGAALGIHAEQFPTEETVAAAADAGVDALELQGAVNTTQLEPRAYLIAVGELALPAPPPAPPGWPFGGSLGQRIFCIESIESGHGRWMWNPAGWPPPFYNEHAAGWLGWLPSTARRWGVTIGDRVSEWLGAAAMIRAGAGAQFFGVSSGRC